MYHRRKNSAEMQYLVISYKFLDFEFLQAHVAFQILDYIP